MITLYDSQTGAKVGRITEDQLQALMGWMEEESEDDRDYFVSAEELELMAEDGIDPTLIDVLKQALGNREEMDIRYEKES
ncbi:MAG TPA: galactosyldiacylglycerol synthase [Anaerolineae bacterium]|nr:galactosyldiacylglycerol synthase [Anaerolineae bacterium]